MITQEEVSGCWNELKGRIKQEWGGLSDDEWQHIDGSIDRLIATLQNKTGEARSVIEDTLRSWSEESGHVFSDATAAVQDYASKAVGSAKEHYGQAQDVVKRHPAESVIVSFGTGLLIGVVVGLLTRSK